MGLPGSHRVRRLCGDPRGKFHRYLRYAPGRPELSDAPCVADSASAAVESASWLRQEAGISDDR